MLSFRDKVFVMKPRHVDKQTNSRPKSRSKSGSGSRSKSKKKKPFDPIKYLNAVIDLPVLAPAKRKKQRGRDISSAITVATPVLSQNVSSVKLRSRSSYSQYRKKDSVVMKDLLNVNLFDIITEEDLIKFT